MRVGLGRFANREIWEGLGFGLCVSVIAEVLLSGVVAQGVPFSFGKVFNSSILLAVFYVFIVTINNHRRKFKDLLTLGAVVASELLLMCFGEPLIHGLAQASDSWVFFVGFSPESIYFALPLASGPMLLQLVLGLRFGLICAFSLGFLFHHYVSANEVFLVHILATSLVGCFCLRRVRSRSAYSRAGLYMFLMASLIIFCNGIDGKTAQVDIVIQIFSAGAGAVLAFLIASGFAPLLEVLGGYVTDLRLIEMATLDHPLLKDLSVQAPGTWNHSMVMGMMSEAAADAIGANPVLAKVGSYFHDIGKSKKPLYFVENQFGGENRHDKLSPSMSALIIRSHVKDGLEMAKRHRLPESLMDMISQHHGTSTIQFFYDKALKEAEGREDSADVDITHYQYPGPKPQTREAGILMLADGIEAASRTMQEPSFDRIQGMVQKLINKVFASGQLEESDLTLRDLHKIARCFTRVLSGIYHQRIAYSEPVEKGGSKVKDPEESPDAPSQIADQGSEGNPTKASGSVAGEDLKRLGVE